MKKNDMVKTVYRGTTYHGLVKSIAGGKIRMVLADDPDKILTANAAAFTKSDLALDKDHPFVASYPKGMAVKVDLHDGKGKRDGVITKAAPKSGVDRKAGVVLLDDPDAGYDIPVIYLERGQMVEPAKPAKDSPVADWSVSGYKHYKYGRDSEIFDAKILFRGKPVLTIENDGNGGCDFIQAIKPEHREMAGRLRADCAKWFADRGDDRMIEPESSWFQWCQHKRPVGISEDSYRDDLIASIARYR